VLLRLAAPPTEAAKALERLGVSTKDASGNMRPFGDILSDVDRSMKDLNLGSAEQIEIQNALFGKTAIASGAILQQAAANGELSAKTKELMESQGAAAEMAKIQNDNLAGAFTRLRSAIQGFQIEIMGGTNPALQSFVDFAANAINVVDRHDGAVPARYWSCGGTSCSIRCTRCLGTIYCSVYLGDW
jgi:TP901 family phage tail tape measure protein